MSTMTWNTADTERALSIWKDYERQHDLKSRAGQTAGIDPVTERIWFGTSAKDIWLQMQAEGLESPLYYVRVGSEHYVRKGGRR